MKQCATCRELKNDEDFNWRWKALGIRHVTCRECRKTHTRKWYENHKEEHLENVKTRKYKVRGEARQYVWNYLLTHPCTNCGEPDPVVLEFHHLHGKDKAVSAMVLDGLSIDSIQKEIDKCVVLCANCHRRVTAKERKWFRG